MKRKLLAMAAALSAIVALAIPATAVIGPDDPYGPDPTFEVVVEETTRPVTIYEPMTFDRAHGWDFGDREGYGCVLVELFTGGDLTALFEFEQLDGYVTNNPGTIVRFNDRGGLENNDGPASPPFPDPIPAEYGATFSVDKGTWDVCGSPAGQGTWVPSGGEDHFPHMVTSSDPATHGVIFYRDGLVDPVITADLNGLLVNGDCDRAYWTPGDEANELALWWDEDFPENGHHDGTQPLDCGGGGDEPLLVGRLLVKAMDANIGFCILDHNLPTGRVCSGMTEPPPPPSPTPTPSPLCPGKHGTPVPCPPPKT